MRPAPGSRPVLPGSPVPGAERTDPLGPGGADVTTCPLETRPGPPFRLPPIVPEGVRNSVLTQRGGQLRHRGLGEGEIRRVLLVDNARVCRPPLEPSEVAAIARSVARYPPCRDTHGHDAAGEGPADPLGDPPRLIPLTWGRPPRRNPLETARRRGIRQIGSVSIVDLRRSLFNVGGRRGGGPFHVNLGGSAPTCSCRWRTSKANLIGTCAHVEASRAFVRLRYGLLEGPGSR